MGKMLTHDSIAKGLWRRDYCSASPAMDAWGTILNNTREILLLTIERMNHDYESLNPKMRKCYGFKEVAAGLNVSFVVCSVQGTATVVQEPVSD